MHCCVQKATTRARVWHAVESALGQWPQPILCAQRRAARRDDYAWARTAMGAYNPAGLAAELCGALKDLSRCSGAVWRILGD